MAASLGSLGTDTADCHSAKYNVYLSGHQCLCEESAEQQALDLWHLQQVVFCLALDPTQPSSVLVRRSEWQQALGLLELMLQTRVCLASFPTKP